MLPLWFGYGDFDGECESAVEDDRQDHVFPVVAEPGDAMRGWRVMKLLYPSWQRSMKETCR